MKAPAFSHDPSATAAFAALSPDGALSAETAGVRAVVIGGGTGAPVSIRTLLSMGVACDVVVAMADDGGSTGILRQAAHATAPGDVRKCITAMAADADDPLTRAFKCRFSFADNHTLGNLMLSTLERETGSFPQAIAICEELLGARGHVYPSTLDRVTLRATTREGRVVEGQAVASHSRCALARVELRAQGGVVAYEPALAAIRAADLVVLGPGSLFTSIVPNLLVPGVVQALRSSSAACVFVCSLADMQGETRGMTAREHVEALYDHGMEGLVDYVLVHDPRAVRPSGPDDEGPAVRPVPLSREDVRAIEARGPVVLVRDLVDHDHPTWHDPQALRGAFAEVLTLCRSRRM